MKVVVTAQGADLDSMSSPVFGRCPAFVFVDAETMQFESAENSSAMAGGGAGVQAAQFVIEKGANAVLSHNVGPNAFAVLLSAGVGIFQIDGGTVRQGVEDFVAGKLPRLDNPNVGAHRGVGGGRRLRGAGNLGRNAAS